MPTGDEILIQTFRDKYQGAAKSICVKHETLWQRIGNNIDELLMQVWITFDNGRVIIEKGSFERLAEIASEPVR
jgi:hypothetical protein